MASWSATAIRDWSRAGSRPAPDAHIPGLFAQSELSGFFNDLVETVVGMNADVAVRSLAERAAAERDRVLSAHGARAGGFAPAYRQIVDGIEGAPLDAVQPDGTIVFIWSILPEVARNTYQALVERSPRESGAYVEGLLLFVDGEPSGFQAITIDTKEVSIVASVPYARRLEVGKTKSGAPFVHQVAPHIVEETAIMANRVYGNLAVIQFVYTDLTDAWQIKNPRGHRRKRGMLETQVRYPTISIKPRLA